MLQTVAQDPPHLVGAAGWWGAAREHGLGFGESREEILMLYCPLRPAVVLVVAFSCTFLCG